jgi:hypothetical protein
VTKPEGKRLLGRQRYVWVDSIKMDLREVALGGMDWIDIYLYRDQWKTLMNMVMNIRDP